MALYSKQEKLNTFQQLPASLLSPLWMYGSIAYIFNTTHVISFRYPLPTLIPTRLENQIKVLAPVMGLHYWLFSKNETKRKWNSEIEVTSSHKTNPTSPLWSAAAWSRNVSYDMMRTGLTVRRPWVWMKPFKFRSISSLVPESITNEFNRPFNHLLISFCQFCRRTFQILKIQFNSVAYKFLLAKINSFSVIIGDLLEEFSEIH